MFKENIYALRKYKTHVYYHAMVLYPQLTQVPCSIKGCIHKKGNGRCGLKEIRLELDEYGELTGTCLCFKERGGFK